MRSAAHEQTAAPVAPRDARGVAPTDFDDAHMGAPTRAARATSSARRESKPVLAWTLAAFALRLAALACFEHVISPDGVEYVALARKLAAGDVANGLSTYWAPLYPALVGLASLLFRDAEFAGRFVSVVAGALLVLPAHALMRRFYGRRVALVGAALVALHPLLVYYSTALLTESTYTLFFTWGLLAGWKALAGKSPRAYALAGAVFGACYLLKPEAAFFVPLLLATTFVRGRMTKARLRRSSVRNALALFIGFAVTAAPYILYLRSSAGVWMLSGKTGAHILQGARLAGGESSPAPVASPADAAAALARLAKALRFEYEIFNLIFPATFVLLVALGLFRRRWTRARAARELYLAAFVSAALAGYAVTLPNIRFLAPLLPALLCWVSKGVAEFGAWARETLDGLELNTKLKAGARGLATPLVVAALLASLAPLFVYLMRGDKWGDYYGQKRAGVWIKEREGARAPVIMSTVPVAAFYAGGRNVALADEDYGALLSRARREGARYVVVNERDFRFMNSLRALLDARAEHEGLRLACEFAEAPDKRVLVYEVEDAAGAAAR